MFIRKELAKLKKAGLWTGDPNDPAIDPAIKLSMFQIDPNVSPELQAICARTLLDHWHSSLALQLKEKQGEPARGATFVLVRQFATEAQISAAKGNIDYNEPSAIALRDRSVTPPVPTPATPAAIDRTNAPGAEVFQMRTDASGIARPVRDETRVPTGYYQTRRGEDGIERLVETDKPPRQYHGEDDSPVVVIKTFKDYDA